MMSTWVIGGLWAGDSHTTLTDPFATCQSERSEESRTQDRLRAESHAQDKLTG